MVELALAHLLKELRALDSELRAVGARLKTIAGKGLDTADLQLQLSSMTIQVQAINDLLERVIAVSIQDEIIMQMEAEIAARSEGSSD